MDRSTPGSKICETSIYHWYAERRYDHVELSGDAGNCHYTNLPVAEMTANEHCRLTDIYVLQAFHNNCRAVVILAKGTKMSNLCGHAPDIVKNVTSQLIYFGLGSVRKHHLQILLDCAWFQDPDKKMSPESSTQIGCLVQWQPTQDPPKNDDGESSY
jgi:hypothetical protein